MALSKLHRLYTFDTSCFYTDEEYRLNAKLARSRALLARAKEQKSRYVKVLHKISKKAKESLIKEMSSKPDLIRSVRSEAIKDKNVVAIFDSFLTRTFGLDPTIVNESMVIVRVFYFPVAEQLIKNGFVFNGRKFSFFSASAGQIRTKKMVFCDSEMLDKRMGTLCCGLSIDDINAKGGVNANKYIAYLALCNSATDEWENFDIDKCIVVNDFTTQVSGTYDVIDEHSFEAANVDTSVEIKHSDGCGMILPSLSRKNFIFRAPWIKGLLTPFDFVRFVKENQCPKVTDIYGMEHDVVKEEIEIIFTKSQFKMWGFYKSWDDYKQRFKANNCAAGKCNVEDAWIGNAKINYQMLQTLTDITDEELDELCAQTNDTLKTLCSDRETMLKVFGAVSSNAHKSGFQKCLEKYPELLADPHSRATLLDLKKSMERRAWAGRLEIDGKYLYLVPDVYALCENLFLGQKDPIGLLENGEVYARVFKNSDKLDCLRSPHLYMEHAVRTNCVQKKPEIAEWFTTKAIYTSCHDSITKIVQADVDGDKLLVVRDKTLVSVAERNAQGVVPLAYPLRAAVAHKLDLDSMYSGMVDAYTGGNIGTISNSISKAWNTNPSKYLYAIKVLTYLNNATIDYAKTLYKPVLPKDVAAQVKDATKGRLPAFFVYAKGKAEEKVEPPTNSTVNRIRHHIPTRKFAFSSVSLGRFDYRVLMHDPHYVYSPEDAEIIDRYHKLSSSIKLNSFGDDTSNGCYYHMCLKLVESLLELNHDILYVCDVIVAHLFGEKNSRRKAVFWQCFGDVVFENIEKNLDDSMLMCRRCGERYIAVSGFSGLCKRCSHHLRRRARGALAK